jgi:hypothetical protein
MLAALLLAACTEPVFFPADFSGPTCVAARQDVECGCSEGFQWDPVTLSEAGTPLVVDRYEVARKTVSSGTEYTVGARYIQTGFDEDTGEPWSHLATAWFPALDNPFPQEGTVYEYRVRACAAAKCGEWSGPVRYVAAPYGCFEDGAEVSCYVGDPVEMP